MEATIVALGEVTYAEGDSAQAAAFFEEGLALARITGNRHPMVWSLNFLGHIAKQQGNYEEAMGHFAESLRLSRQLMYLDAMIWSLEGLSGVAGAQQDGQRAARLYGAVEALRETWKLPQAPRQWFEYENDVAIARALLNEETFAAARAEGWAMALEQAIAYTLEDDTTAD